MRVCCLLSIPPTCPVLLQVVHVLSDTVYLFFSSPQIQFPNVTANLVEGAIQAHFHMILSWRTNFRYRDPEFLGDFLPSLSPMTPSVTLTKRMTQSSEEHMVKKKREVAVRWNNKKKIGNNPPAKHPRTEERVNWTAASWSSWLTIYLSRFPGDLWPRTGSGMMIGWGHTSSVARSSDQSQSIYLKLFQSIAFLSMYLLCLYMYL